MKHLGRLSCALFYDDLALGTSWKTAGRTILESDLSAYIGLSWFHEDLFTNQHDRAGMAIPGRPVPGAMVFAMAEGLVLPWPKGWCCLLSTAAAWLFCIPIWTSSRGPSLATRST